MHCILWYRIGEPVYISLNIKCISHKMVAIQYKIWLYRFMQLIQAICYKTQI